MATVTFLHAHPDDEAIVTAGTMAQLARDGHRVVLVVATRGELGEQPDARITTEVDVRDVLDLKRRAMRAHASQIAEDSFFLAVPDDVSAALWGSEWYVRVDLTAPRPEAGALPSPEGLTGREDRLALVGSAPVGGARP